MVATGLPVSLQVTGCGRFAVGERDDQDVPVGANFGIERSRPRTGRP